MSERKTYTAKATRTGTWWAIEVPEVEGVFTQARRLEQVEDVTREAIALMLDVAEDSFDVALSVDLPMSWAVWLEELRAAQEVQALVEARTSALLRVVAAQLRDAGLPVRDVGTIMGRSAQRISQLLGEGNPLESMKLLLSMESNFVDVMRHQRSVQEYLTAADVDAITGMMPVQLIDNPAEVIAEDSAPGSRV